MNKRLRFKVRSAQPVDVWRAREEDIARLVFVCNARGYDVSPEDVTKSWEEYSDSMCAGWLFLHESDDAVFEDLFRYLEVVPEGCPTSQMIEQLAADRAVFKSELEVVEDDLKAARTEAMEFLRERNAAIDALSASRAERDRYKAALESLACWNGEAARLSGAYHVEYCNEHFTHERGFSDAADIAKRIARTALDGVNNANR